MKIDIEVSESSKWVIDTDELTDRKLVNHIEECARELLKPLEEQYKKALEEDKIFICDFELR